MGLPGARNAWPAYGPGRIVKLNQFSVVQFPIIVVSQALSLAHGHARDLFVKHRAPIDAVAEEFLCIGKRDTERRWHLSDYRLKLDFTWQSGQKAGSSKQFVQPGPS
jgi:hypothetical protein